MSLYDIIAAGHQGQCFSLLGRKFLIKEPQAADAVRHLLPAVLPSLDAWVSTADGMAGFLDALSRGGYGQTLRTPTLFCNSAERIQALHLLAQWELARKVDGAAVAEASFATGVPERVLKHMLPWVAVLVMAAIRPGSEVACRAILASRLGTTRKSIVDPFGELLQLIAQEAQGTRQGPMTGLLGKLFGRRENSTAMPSGLTFAAPGPH